MKWIKWYKWRTKYCYRFNTCIICLKPILFNSICNKCNKGLNRYKTTLDKLYD